METLFAVAAPSLEPIVRLELEQLGLIAPRPAQAASSAPEQGGIEFSGDLQAIYRANLHLRTANRVLLRFARFHAAAFSELRRKATPLNWERFLRPGQTIAIRVTCHKSRLYHSSAVARELSTAIGDRLGKPPVLVNFDEDSDTPLITARLQDDECTLSIDTSGGLLHRRGYRLETAKAPLRETLAAAMLLASGWDGRSPLIDPFCGSGTIAIEAALLGRGIAPGARRRFAFMDWPGYNPAHWQTLLAENEQHQQARLAAGALPKIYASDRDAGAIRIAQSNAERAGLAEDIEFACQAVSAITPAGKGWVVTNPPYGLRLDSSKDLRNLYAQFGKVLRLQCPGWNLGVLCSDPALLSQIGFKLDTSLAWLNGGAPVKFGRAVVPGSPKFSAPE